MSKPINHKQGPNIHKSGTKDENLHRVAEFHRHAEAYS